MRIFLQVTIEGFQSHIPKQTYKDRHTTGNITFPQGKMVIVICFRLELSINELFEI